ncbi:MAG: LIC_13387 family protein [Steroidobacteraceae bacterium]
MAPLETHRVKRAMEINTAGGLGVHGQAPAHRSVLQRHFNFYRLASYTLGLFALGHTFGALVNTPRLGSASDQVVARMQSVGVLAQGARTTWYDFYLAFGYLDTIFFLFSMVVAWFLGGRLPQERRALWPIAWALLASQVGGLVITSCFLFPAPIVFSGVLVLLLGAGCVADSLART